MTPWRWWTGYDQDGQPESYDIAECASRSEAIKAGIFATNVGEIFHIIEARSSTDRRHEQADIVPFLRTRNHEVIVNSIQAPPHPSYFGEDRNGEDPQQEAAWRLVEGAVAGLRAG